MRLGHKIGLIGCAMVLLLTPVMVQAGSESIVAVVNKGVITESDIQARMGLIAASSGLKPSKELDEKLRPQIIEMLIDEQIRSQEADRLGLKVDEKEIDKGYSPAVGAQNRANGWSHHPQHPPKISVTVLDYWIPQITV